MQSLLSQVPPQKSCALVVNLQAIQENFRTLQNFIGPQVQMSAVLKANAYGLGQDTIAAALAKIGCKHFFYAYLDEAIQARAQNPNAQCYIFNGLFPNTESLCVHYNIIPCLISFDQVLRWIKYGQKIQKKLPCILHLDTGMGREGLSPQELTTLLNSPHRHTLDILYIMSHLSHAQDSKHPDNARQLQKFNALKEYFPTIPASLANSSGITLGSAYHYDLVRPGMALYGYKKHAAYELYPCLAAYTRILRVRSVPKGSTLGYNGTYRCSRDTQVALLATGHRDGILRAASNQASVLINHQAAPIIGTVSMDLIMVDITDHPQGSVHVNDWALLYHTYAQAHAFAHRENTSIYELLVRHHDRYHLLYTKEMVCEQA